MLGKQFVILILDQESKDMKNILITGGAGFIGIHLSNELVNQGYSVTVLDNLSPHVHGLDAFGRMRFFILLPLEVLTNH